MLVPLNGFSRYVQRHLYHPCSELGMCKKAWNKWMDGVTIGWRNLQARWNCGSHILYISITWASYRVIGCDKWKRTVLLYLAVGLCWTKARINGHRFPSIGNIFHQPRSTRINQLLTGTHSDPTSGDLWIGQDGDHNPCAASVSHVSTGLFYYFILILTINSTVAWYYSWAI